MRMFVILLGCVFLVGCRGEAVSPTPIVEQAKDGKKSADKPEEKKKDPPAPVAQKEKDWAEEIKALKPVDPVAIEKLLALLPKAPADYKAREPLSETIDFEASVHGQEAYSFKYNLVEGKYKNGDKTLTVRIIDTARIAEFYKWIPGSATLKEEFDAGFEKGLTIDGDPAIEKYFKSTQRGDLTVMVAKRFQIEISADGIPPEFVQAVFKSLDRKALTALK
jgi:hypothetical protein